MAREKLGFPPLDLVEEVVSTSRHRRKAKMSTAAATDTGALPTTANPATTTADTTSDSTTVAATTSDSTTVAATTSDSTTVAATTSDSTTTTTHDTVTGPNTSTATTHNTTNRMTTHQKALLRELMRDVPWEGRD